MDIIWQLTLTLSRRITSFSVTVSVQWNALALREGRRMSIALDLPTLFSPYFKQRAELFNVPIDSPRRYQFDDRWRGFFGMDTASGMYGVSYCTRMKIETMLTKCELRFILISRNNVSVESSKFVRKLTLHFFCYSRYRVDHQPHAFVWFFWEMLYWFSLALRA